MIVGGLDSLLAGEGPQGRPELQKVLCHAATVAVARPLGREGADDRLVSALQRADTALKLMAIVGVPEDLPCPEDALTEGKAGIAELLLGGEPFGVRGEVAPQVRPAELAAVKRQV